MRLLRLFLLLPLLVNFAFAATVVTKKDLNFSVAPNTLRLGKLNMAIEFISTKDFYRYNIASIDVENLSQTSNTELAFLKAAFIVNKPITDFDHAFFLNEGGIKGIYDANSVTKKEDFLYRIGVSEMGISMDFDLKIDFKDDYVSTTDRFEEWIDAAIDLDHSLSNAVKYQLLTQSNFTRIFKKSVTINMFIPYGDQTVVVSYSIAAADKRAIDKIDSIPFVNAHKILMGQLRDCIKRTYNVMAQ